jgi:hypothetical protein
MKGYEWIRTRKPLYREEIGEAWYIGINVFLVFAGLYAMAAISQISSPPLESHLQWVFEFCVGFGKSKCGEPTFFLRLKPDYLVIVAIIALLRPKGDYSFHACTPVFYSIGRTPVPARRCCGLTHTPASTAELIR